MAEFDLYYWPTLPGRGEYIRLILEEAGAEYRDVARLPEAEGGGMQAVLGFYRGERAEYPVFAPPVLVHGELCLAQTPLICSYLGEHFGLVSERREDRLHALQLMLTLADWALEIHDTHHPISVSLYYEDQREEALRRTRHFVSERVGRFESYFSRVLQRGGGEWLFGNELSYVDLALAHTLAGLEYALPRAYSAHFASDHELAKHRERVEARSRIAAYLASERRLPFNEDGLFRRYPELDLAPE